jgi:hypothetical protein
MTPMPPPVAPSNELAPPPDPQQKPGWHEHDGFYAHFGLGFSGYSDALKSDEVTPPGGGAETTVEGVVTGFATVSEVAVGGTIGTGFVLGLGLWSTTALTTTFTPVDDDDLPAGVGVPEEFARPENFVIVGPFIDWFFNPRRGVHFQAALGLATLSGINTESPRLRDRDTAFGGGLMLGLGHEWWVAGNWGVGVLGRLTAGIVTEEDDAGARWNHLVFAFPSMLFTATYH